MQKITNSDILALIDDLNQYLNGNLTILGLSESIKELQNKLQEAMKELQESVDKQIKKALNNPLSKM